jgi:hypothetical protein
LRFTGTRPADARRRLPQPGAHGRDFVKYRIVSQGEQVVNRCNDRERPYRRNITENLLAKLMIEPEIESGPLQHFSLFYHRSMRARLLGSVSRILCLAAITISAAEPRTASTSNSRPPRSDTDLREWLQNMVWRHRFTTEEIRSATGLTASEISAALKRLDISEATRPKRRADAPLLVLPYPGGRHPRIGFLDGAISPQRETKISVFTPWDETSYVVADIPEAIWSNLGLTYLAHTHVPTIWTKQNITLEPLEWNRRPDGVLHITRKLPNGIAFTTHVQPLKDGVLMELSLTNGSKTLLSDLRVQNCVMLKGAKDFDAQSNTNKTFHSPYVACRDTTGARWIITAWEPCHRPWANPPVPCLHSDPKFPDCPPGETKRLRGWLSFYQGTNIHSEFQRLDVRGWRERPLLTQ